MAETNAKETNVKEINAKETNVKEASAKEVNTKEANTKETISIVLKLFAIYQETLGVSERALTLPQGTTAGDVRDRLIQEHPSLAEWKDLTRFGINLQFSAADTTLAEGDELVLIPPVSGG